MYNNPPDPIEHLFAALKNMEQAGEQIDQHLKNRLKPTEMDRFRTQCKALEKDSLPWYLEYFEELEMYEHCAVVKALIETA
ncbi:hypothetical protein [Telluribacter sp.]|jgi:hypothetical protein|uniref:hypothetical protein n=1 Tax=Telluribacter sp. TaxID=1978767 RepID=UPI002E105491|nr:hypothetical protein [Telluribacter sp.]